RARNAAGRSRRTPRESPLRAPSARARAPPARARRARMRRGRRRRRRRTHAWARPHRGGAAEPGARSGALPPRLGDEVGREPVQLLPWQSGDDEHAVGRVLALLDRRTERVQLREARAVLVRKQEAHLLPPRAEMLGDPGAQLLEPFAVSGRDLRRTGEPVAEPAPPDFVEQVDLVQDELARERGRPDLREHLLDRRHLALDLLVGSRRIDDVQDHVRDERLLECRREPLDELVRQPPDEADGVGDEVAATFVLEGARRRVERLEQAVLDGDVGAGERVQERRLADVRVPGERHLRGLRPRPLLASRRALALELRQPPLQERHPAPREAPVGLELRLAGAARADPAAEPLEVLPHPPHPRQVVLELRELDLQLSLGRDRVLREDVEDQLRAVDDARRERVLEESLLHRIELVVDEQALRLRGREALLELLELALPDVRAARRMGPMLNDTPDRLDAGRARELFDLGELLVGLLPLRQDREDQPALRLRRTWDHRGKYAPRNRARPAHAGARRSPVPVPRRGTRLRLRPRRAPPPPARARRRRDPPLRTPRREAARAARRAYGHRPASGQPPRPDRRRRRPRARRDRHEGRARGDDRARPVRPARGARLRPRPALLPARGGRPRAQPPAGALRGRAGRRRGGARRLPR